MNDTLAVKNVEADKKRPWKAVGTFLATMVVALFYDLKGKETLEGMTVTEWFMVVLGALVVAIVTYVIPNPLVRKT